MTARKPSSSTSIARTRVSARLLQARRLLRRIRATLKPGSAPTDRPRPHVVITMTRSVPAWGLRLVLLAVGLVCVLVIGDSRVARVLLSGALLFVMVVPGSVATAVFTVVVGLSLLAFDPGPLSGVIPVLIAAVHLIAVLGSVVGQLPLRTAVELRALLPSLRRYVVIQAIAQLLGVVAGWISERAVVVTALPIVAVLALVAGAGWLFPRLHRP